MQLSNAIFSNHKSESYFGGEISLVVESLRYLDQRVRTLSEKRQSTDFSSATNCLNAMESDIQDAVACKSTPALNRS